MHIPKQALTAIEMLNHAGYEAYVVGGCVRDHVLGIAPHDFDICTSAVPSEMQQVFAACRTVETGLKHGTLTVIMEKMPLEITTFRLDGEYLDNRHPREVTFTRALENDLSRRDFTVNAMAYHPERGIVDLFGGQTDCQKGIIRCVGDAGTRFHEDALRILRALRFAARFRFAIEEKTKSAVFSRQHLLKNISAERIAAELNGLLPAEGAGDILAQFRETIFTAVPEMAMPAENWQAALRMLSCTEKDLLLRWCALLAPLGADKANTVLKQLKMPNALQNDVQALLSHLGLPLSEEKMQRTLMLMGDRLVFPLISLQRAQKTALQPEKADFFAREEEALARKARQLKESHACYTLAALAVKGGDLPPLGIQGRDIGLTLEKLLAAVVDGQCENEKEKLLSLASNKQ